MKTLLTVATTAAIAATMFFTDPSTALQTGSLSVSSAQASDDSTPIEIARLVKLPSSCVASGHADNTWSCDNIAYKSVVENGEQYFINIGAAH